MKEEEKFENDITMGGKNPLIFRTGYVCAKVSQSSPNHGASKPNSPALIL